jgi:hypothetical protein
LNRRSEDDGEILTYDRENAAAVARNSEKRLVGNQVEFHHKN